MAEVALLASGKDEMRLEPSNAGKLYAVGDIHGRLDCLRKIHAKIRSDSTGSAVRGVIYLGDYIDRGPDSRGVIDELVSCDMGMKRFFLLGNHEHALMMFLRGGISYQIWKNWGADETLKSYGLKTALFKGKSICEQTLRKEFLEAIPESHIKFFDQLLPYCVDDKCIYVHAGIRPEVDLDKQLLEDLIMIREEFLSYPGTFKKTVIFGHTIFEEPDVREDRVGIDTGAYRTGRLTALVMESGQQRFLSS